MFLARFHGHGLGHALLDDDGPHFGREHGRGALGVGVLLLPDALLIGDLVATEVIDLIVGPNHAEVHVGAGAHVVEDTGGDGVADQLLRGILLKFSQQ